MSYAMRHYRQMLHTDDYHFSLISHKTTYTKLTHSHSIVKKEITKWLFGIFNWLYSAWNSFRQKYFYTFWYFTTFEPTVKLLIKLKNFFNDNVILNAHFIGKNIFVPISPKLPKIAVFWRKNFQRYWAFLSMSFHISQADSKKK